MESVDRAETLDDGPGCDAALYTFSELRTGSAHYGARPCRECTVPRHAESPKLPGRVGE